MSVASLPMYDWPGLRAQTDQLWATLRAEILAKSIDAPEFLDRSRPNLDVWTDSDLVLSQTCSMPWRLRLHSKTNLICTPDYGADGCPPGYYCSVLVVRSDDPRNTIDAFSGAACAVNARDSQSGYGAMMNEVGTREFFSDWIETGAHATSIAAVVGGRADIAAIDAVTWRIALKFQPETAALRILARTDPTPGLPLITSHRRNAEELADAIDAAFVTLDPETRDMLGLVGFVRIATDAYLITQ